MNLRLGLTKEIICDIIKIYLYIYISFGLYLSEGEVNTVRSMAKALDCEIFSFPVAISTKGGEKSGEIWGLRSYHGERHRARTPQIPKGTLYAHREHTKRRSS